MGIDMSIPGHVIRSKRCGETIHRLEEQKTLVLRFFRLIDPRIPSAAHDDLRGTDQVFADDVYRFLLGIENTGVCDPADLEEIWVYVSESLKRARGGRETFPRGHQLRPWIEKHRKIHRNPLGSDPHGAKRHRTQ
jgi:hypothetical protein